MARRRKIISWKQKQIFTILAPKDFEYKEIGNCVAKEPENLIGRTVDVSLFEILGDKAKQHMKIIFEITDVKGDKANTRFKRFEINPGYLRSKVRKGASKIDTTTELNLKDDTRIQMKITTIANQHISTPKEKDIRSKIFKIIESYRDLKLDEFVQQVIASKVGGNIYKEVKKISPIKRVEVEEIKVI